MKQGVFQSEQTKFQDKKDEIISQIDKYDSTMFSYLARLYEALSGEKMDFDKVKTAVDALAVFNQKSEYNYLNNLLYPEKCKGVKIPSPIPVPSCSFQLHNCVTLTTNSSGNLAFIFNPFFLANSEKTSFSQNVYYPDSQTGPNYIVGSANATTLWVCNGDGLSGHEAYNGFHPMYIGQTIPGVYDQYRLVSASLIVKYIGRLDITSGVIGGAIIYDDNKCIGGNIIAHEQGQDVVVNTMSRNDELAKYGNFDLAMDSYYHQENLVLEGLRELYFPLDNSYEEYTQLADMAKAEYVYKHEGHEFVIRMNDTDIYKSGFNYFVYVLGAPANSACFKVDIYCNFECLPNASFLNYLPLSMNTGNLTSAEKKMAIATVQQKHVMSMKDKDSLIVKKPTIWEKLKNKFGNALPGISKLIGWGLTNMIPGLKPGLTLAGNLISNQNAGIMEEEVE